MVAVAERPQLNRTATKPNTPQRRRTTEHDADYQRLHAATVARLRRAIRSYVRALRHPHSGHRNAAAAAFISRMTDVLRSAYEDAHTEGQRHYWSSVSKKTRGLPLLPAPP